MSESNSLGVIETSCDHQNDINKKNNWLIFLIIGKCADFKMNASIQIV